MKKIISFVINLKGIKKIFFVLIISFSHSLLSIPFSYFQMNSFHQNEIKAFWQPPDFVFGIVWPILYAIFAIINLYTFNSKKISLECKVNILSQSTFEAVGQTIWLILFTHIIFPSGSFFHNHGLNYYSSALIIVLLSFYAIFYRFRTLWSCNKKLGIMLVPYLLWITFASILNIQILYRFINKV